MSLKQLNIQYQIIKSKFNKYHDVFQRSKDNKSIFCHQLTSYFGNKNTDHSKVSECSTSLEDDLIKISPNKKIGDSKKFNWFSAMKSEKNIKNQSKINTKTHQNSDNLYKLSFTPKQSHKKYINIEQTINKLNKLTHTNKQLSIYKQYKNEDKKKQQKKQIQDKNKYNNNEYLLKQIHKNNSQQILLKKIKLTQIQNHNKNIKKINSFLNTNIFIKSNHPPKISDFQLGKYLGKGKFGYVQLARHKQTGFIFSIKTINKNKIKQQQIINRLIQQIKIQNLFNHCHIAKLYSVFDDLQHIYFIMELGTQGNLYQYIQKVGRISQKRVRELIKQTCQAIKQVHSNKIIHRDIKPQNIVLCFGMAKLCDFGWSTSISDGQLRKTFCGSPLYISPQLLKKQLHDEKVDLWAVGILCYQMLTGTIPFNISSQQDLIKIINQQVFYPPWLSDISRSFIQKLLQKNPKNRLNIKQILSHDYIKNINN